MKSCFLLSAVLVAGCIPVAESPAGPAFGQDSVAELSARGNAIWRKYAQRAGITVIAQRVFGPPSAVWIGRKVTMNVPVGANGELADALMAYELPKLAYVVGDGSLASELLRPARTLGASQHTPPSEILSWYAVAKELTN